MKPGPPKGATLQLRIRHAYAWTILGSIARYAANLGISLLLTRLLKPEDYGLIGMISVFTELLIGIYDWGLAQGVVHFREENPNQERPTYFTAALMLGASFTILLFVAAPLIADFYGEPRLIILLRVLSFTLTVGSVRSVSGSILARELRFKVLSFADIFASLTSGVVAIVMAYLGFGVWSLVVNLCLFTVLQAAAYGWYAPPRFRLPLDRRIAVRLWRYSAPLTGSSILSKIYDNADYLVVGKVLGVTPLGYYTLAFRVAMLINERISAVINRVAFPSFANLKEDTPRVVEHWFAVTRRVTLITFPLLVWLAFSAEDLIRVALGTRWLPAALPLQFLCGMTAVKILTNVVGQILAAVGYPMIVLRYDIMTAIALPAGFVIGCKTGGLVGMGIAWCTVFPLVRFLFLLATRAALHFSLAAYARNLFEALWVSLLCAALMTPVAWLLPSGLLRLCLGSLTCVVAVLLAVALSSNLRRLIVETISNPFGGE